MAVFDPQTTAPPPPDGFVIDDDTGAPPPPVGFTLDEPAPRRRRSSRALPPPPTGFTLDEPAPSSTPIAAVPLAPTGEAHDGDTFRLNTGKNGRLYGVDAFEINQQAQTPDGVLIPIGRTSREALLPFVKPDASVTDTGASTYGRPVVSLSLDGNDAGKALLDQGLGIVTPQYLKGDPNRLFDYVQANRLARLNRRGAYADTFQTPSSFRHGEPDPWAKPNDPRDWGNANVYFWDQPTPPAGLADDVEAGYLKIWHDPKATADDIIAYGKAHGFNVDAADARRKFAARDKGAAITNTIPYETPAPPRVLTDPGDGAFGSFARGVADPINMLDETGAIVDSLVPDALYAKGQERENVWSSPRRFGDILANNLEQNRAILDYDEQFHPWARTGGQLASGLIVPGASVEGVGAAAFREAIEAGAGEYAARQIAKRAVAKRLATAGAAEGGLAGAGGGEDLPSRIEGATIGAPLGAALGVGTGYVLPEVVSAVPKVFRRGASTAEGDAVAADVPDTSDLDRVLATPPTREPVDYQPPQIPEALHPADAVAPAPRPAGVASGNGLTDREFEAARRRLWQQKLAQEGGESSTVAAPLPTQAMANETPTPSLTAPVATRGARPRPILDPATEAERRAAAERIEPGDVLPSSPQSSEPEPDLAGNIRLDKLDSPQQIKRALTATDQFAGGFDAARRGHIAHVETEQLAGDLGVTADDLLRRRKGEAFNAEQALAARQLLARSGNELVNLARRVKASENPGDELLAKFREAWLRHAAIQEQVSGATAEAGRALSQFRFAANSRLAPGRVLASFVESGGGADRLKDAADIIVDSADDPSVLNRVTERALKPRFRDKLVELWYNSLLSGPQTHATNVLSNTLTALGQIPEHAVAAGIGAARRAAGGKGDDRVLFSELGARVAGLLNGTREGLRGAARTMRTGEASDHLSKVENSAQQAISGVKGKIIRLPTRALSAEDELFKAMARRMEIAGLAVRKANSEGLRGAAARQRAGELAANPTDDMLERAFDYGRYVTFQRPLGPAGQAVSRFTQSVPIAKLFVPFVRTPTNLLKFAAERSPAAPLLKEWRQDVAAGGARRDLALAKAMVGSGVMALVTELAAQGKITGGGPADQNAKALLRDKGWQPYSVRIGDKYYSYQRLDPYSTTLGLAADMVDLQSHMTDKQRQGAATRLVASALQNLSSKTWLSGVSNLVDAINDPDRYAGSFIQRLAGSIAVPAGVAQAARTADPVQRQVRTMLDAIRARVPGASTSLPPRRDVWGKPIVHEGGLGPDIVSPIWESTARKDPVDDALLASGVHVGKPSQTVNGEPLDDEAYGRYREAVGTAERAAVDQLLQSGVLPTLGPDDRRDLLKKTISSARTDARVQMFGRRAHRGSTPRRRRLPPPPAGFVIDQP